ncbi:unnamed protein product [Schistosoma turkestanicum]|nr:unnamed protein product [Schistosoma turkestanicum]
MTVWPLLLCVAEMKNKNKDIYTKMLQKALSSSASLSQIDLDVNRTFRNTIYFRDRYCPRQCALFRVLAAYSVYNSEVGYCQGMSELAGIFLIYIEDEEDAFWALNQLMTNYRYNMHGVYVPGFPGLNRLFMHHERIVRKLLPLLDKHFIKHDMLTSTYALKWYMQCFLDRLPVTLVLRIWDIYLLEGEKLLLAMAYNILKMHCKRLLRMDQMQMTAFFQDELAKDFLFDDDTVIDSLKECLEVLHKIKLDTPPPLSSDMQPKRLDRFNSDPVWHDRNGGGTLMMSTTQTSTLKPSIDIPLPSIKPQLTDQSNFDRKLNARFLPAHLPRTLSVNPINLNTININIPSSTLELSSSLSPPLSSTSSSLSKRPDHSSPGLITSTTSVLTNPTNRRYYSPTIHHSSKSRRNNPNYILVSNYRAKLNHRISSSSKPETPYSPSSTLFNFDENMSYSGGGGGGGGGLMNHNIPNIYYQSPSITTSSQSLIHSPDDHHYTTTSGSHYRNPLRQSSPNSSNSKLSNRSELLDNNKSNNNEKDNQWLSVDSYPAKIKRSPQLHLSRYTQNKEINIKRYNATGSSKNKTQNPNTPIIVTTPTMTSKSRMNRWTSEQILSATINNRPPSTTSSELSFEEPWQKREKSPSSSLSKHKTLKSTHDYSTSELNSSIDGGILTTTLDKVLISPPLPKTTTTTTTNTTTMKSTTETTYNVWNKPNNSSNNNDKHSNSPTVINYNFPLQSSPIYSPTSPNLSIQSSQDTTTTTKHSQTMLRNSSTASSTVSLLSPSGGSGRSIQIVRIENNTNNNDNDNKNLRTNNPPPIGDHHHQDYYYYYPNVSMKKPYSESVRPINSYVSRIPPPASATRSKLIMKPTEIVMPEPKPIPNKTINKKLITIQSTN